MPAMREILKAAIWGASFLFMRIAAPEFGAINTAFLRVFFGFSGLAVILFVLKSSFNFEGKFKSSLILGVINSGFPFLMYCLAARCLLPQLHYFQQQNPPFGLSLRLSRPTEPLKIENADIWFSFPR